MNIEQINKDLANGVIVSRVAIRSLAAIAREMETTLLEIKGAAEVDDWSALMAKLMLDKVAEK